jgi:hypothetical protein
MNELNNAQLRHEQNRLLLEAAGTINELKKENLKLNEDLLRIRSHVKGLLSSLMDMGDAHGGPVARFFDEINGRIAHGLKPNDPVIQRLWPIKKVEAA